MTIYWPFFQMFETPWFDTARLTIKYHYFIVLKLHESISYHLNVIQILSSLFEAPTVFQLFDSHLFDILSWWFDYCSTNIWNIETSFPYIANLPMKYQVMVNLKYLQLIWILWLFWLIMAHLYYGGQFLWLRTGGRGTRRGCPHWLPLKVTYRQKYPLCHLASCP